MLQDIRVRVRKEANKILEGYDFYDLLKEDFNPMKIVEEVMEDRSDMFFLSLIGKSNMDEILKISRTLFRPSLREAAKIWYVKEVAELVEAEQDKVRTLYDKQNKDYEPE